MGTSGSSVPAVYSMPEGFTHILRTRALTNVSLTSAYSQQRQLMEFFTLLHDLVPMASRIGGYLANPA